MTLEQIAAWKSHRNPLENVLGRKSICPAITTRVAESIGGYKCKYNSGLQAVRNNI